jgi:hypothetical protein
MIAGDFLLGPGYDLATDGGDFVAGEADEQHQALLLLTSPGEWRQDGLVGVGLVRYQSGPMDDVRRAALQRTLTIQLQRDGYTVAKVAVSADSQLTLDAYRPQP